MRAFLQQIRPVLLFFSLVIIVALIHVVFKNTIWQAKQRFHRHALVNYSLSLEILPPVVSPHKSADTFILVLVNSSPNGKVYADKRNAIRRTWGKKASRTTSLLNWTVVFMMGKTYDAVKDELIRQESEKFRDLLIVDFKDKYRDITKKLLTSLEWASRTKYSFVLKTDDDVYVNLPALTDWLLARGQEERLYGGVLYEGRVVRDKKHKHYVSEKDLTLNRYPTFCKGSLYVLSWDLVPEMVRLSRKVNRITPDDAYVGLLANALFVEPVSIDSFVQLKFLNFFIEIIAACQLQKIIGFSDSLSPRHIYYLHQQLTAIKEGNQFCIAGTHVLIALVVLCFVLLCKVCRCRFRPCNFIWRILKY